MNLDLSFYFKLFVRRLPVMMLFVLICSGLGVITALKLPETWSTSARLLVESPQIPENMVNNSIGSIDSEQLDIIQQKLLTRATLIDLANQYRAFPGMSQMSPDDVYLKMREATSIRRSAGRNQAVFMTIGFEARSGQIAANMVNEMVTLVLAENSTSRRTQVENTLGFFEQEVERLADDLNLKSTQIAQFKSDNSEALPVDQRFRVDRINRLQERLAQIDRDKRSIDARQEEVLRIYETTGQVGATDNRVLSPQEQRLSVVKTELENILTLYSETHPQVVRLRNLAERLEEEVAKQQPTDIEQEDNQPKRTTEDLIFQSTMGDLAARKQQLEEETVGVQEEIAKLREATTQAATNEIALATLQRDFENIQRRYNAALNNLNIAQVNERIENRAQGQRITIIENANVPQSPTGPNRPLVATAGGVIGIGLAVAYFLLLELLNRSIRRPEEMINKFSVTPITIVPYMESGRQRFIRRSMRIAALVAVIIAVPLGLWYVDTNYLPLDLLVQRGMEQLGLG